MQGQDRALLGKGFSGLRVVIVGLARQGTALARFFSAQGAHVTVTDIRPAAQLRAEIAALGAADAPKHPPRQILQAMIDHFAFSFYIYSLCVKPRLYDYATVIVPNLTLNSSRHLLLYGDHLRGLRKMERRKPRHQV